jgi:hypothetical protein
MALTLAQGAQMNADGGYRSRVQSSMLRTAYTVRNEAQGALSANAWVKRRAFAVKVLNSPATYLDAFLASLAADGGLSLTWYQPVSITSSTNANPTVVTTTAVHGLAVGDVVEIAGHAGNTNANGVWAVTVVGSTTTFTIAQAASGVGTATGTAMKQETDVTVNFTINNIFSAMVDLNPVSD